MDRRGSIVTGVLGAVALLCAASAGAQGPAGLPRAALVADAPLVPGPAVLSVLHKRLGAGYRLLEDPVLRRELESLERERSPEQQVYDALREALQRMRRLAMEEVQRTLQEAEPYLQQLPPTPSARALLAAVAARRAHVALLLGDSAQATEALQRALSAEPDFTVDQALEPPTLVELLDRVRAGLKEAQPAQLRVTTSPPGALVVVGGRALGRAPLTIPAPADAAVVIWAVSDGYRTRNVTARAAPGGRVLSVDIQLDPLPRAQQLRPLIDALRSATPALRPGAARALRDALGVDAVVLVHMGPGDRPQLRVYGAPPRFPSTGAGPGLAAEIGLQFEPTPRPRRTVPPWLWGVAGAILGAAVSTGVILGTSTR